MNREIRIIKRATRDLFEGAEAETPVTSRQELTEHSSLQITRTIENWIKANNKRNTEKLLVAQSLRRCIY